MKKYRCQYTDTDFINELRETVSGWAERGEEVVFTVSAWSNKSREKLITFDKEGNAFAIAERRTWGNAREDWKRYDAPEPIGAVECFKINGSSSFAITVAGMVRKGSLARVTERRPLFHDEPRKSFSEFLGEHDTTSN